VTILFADVKESMTLADQVDPEEWHRILNRFFTILSEGIHRYEGTINQYTGDGVMALFGAPIAHEDHAQRACHAALLLAEQLRSYATSLRLERGLNFSVRMGINSGEVVVGKIGDDLRMDYTAQGPTVGLAARMEQVAEAGRIYLTEHTARHVRGLFKMKDLGPMQLKGVSDPLPVFELEEVGPLRTRLDVAREKGFSPFVGRRSEMAALVAALERAATGQGQVVGVVGAAGVGKSRLCAEIVDLCRARQIPVHAAHCLAHTKSIANVSILELLRSVFAIGASDSDQAAREKIAGRLLLLDRSFETLLPLLFEFLEVPDPNRPVQWNDEEGRRWRLFGFVRSLVQAQSADGPTVYLLDDAHWLDAASAEIVAQMADAIGGTRALFLLNFRPEYQAEWMAKSYYQQLPLAPLDPDSIGELLNDLLGTDASLADLPALIGERAEGNPFFTEEIIHGLILSGMLIGERGSYRLAKPLGEIQLPATVQAVLAARIDRLSEVEKRVLQTAAVVGKRFLRRAVERVTNLGEEQTLSALNHLVASELLVDSVGEPDADYAFKHPLTQEVAYHSQLLEHRTFTHARVASTLEELYADRLGQQANLIAYHWEAADERYVAARWRRRAALKVTTIQVRKRMGG
jgi:class 3 adenylate cyclase/DNA-binding IscR family transcriptional regulator